MMITPLEVIILPASGESVARGEEVGACSGIRKASTKWCAVLPVGGRPGGPAPNEESAQSIV